MLLESYVLLSSWMIFRMAFLNAPSQDRKQMLFEKKQRRKMNKAMINKTKASVENTCNKPVISALMKRYLLEGCTYAINSRTGELIICEIEDIIPEHSIVTGSVRGNSLTVLEREILLQLDDNHKRGIITTSTYSLELQRIAKSKGISVIELNNRISEGFWDSDPERITVYHDYRYNTITEEDCTLTEGYVGVSPFEAYLYMTATRVFPRCPSRLLNSNFILSAIKNNCPKSFVYDIDTMWDVSKMECLSFNYFWMVTKQVFPNAHIQEYVRAQKYFGYICNLGDGASPQSIFLEILDESGLFDYFETIVIRHLTWQQIDKIYTIVKETELSFEQTWNSFLSEEKIRELCVQITNSMTKRDIDNNIQALAKLIGLSDNKSTIDTTRTLNKILKTSTDLDVQIAGQLILSRDNYLTQSNAAFASKLVDDFIASFDWTIPGTAGYKGRLEHLSSWDTLTETLFRLRGILFENIACTDLDLPFKVEDEKPTLKAIMMEFAKSINTEEQMKTLIEDKMTNMSDILTRKPDAYHFEIVRGDIVCDELEVEKDPDTYGVYAKAFTSKNDILWKIVIHEFGWVQGTYKKYLTEVGRWNSLSDFTRLVAPIELKITLADDNTIDRYQSGPAEYLFRNVEILRNFKQKTAAVVPPTHSVKFTERDGGYVQSTIQNINVDIPEFSKADVDEACDQLFNEAKIKGYEYIPEVIKPVFRDHCHAPFATHRLEPMKIFEVLKKVRTTLESSGDTTIWPTELKRDTKEVIDTMWTDHRRKFKTLNYKKTAEGKRSIRLKDIETCYEGEYSDMCNCLPSTKAFFEALSKQSRFKSVPAVIQKKMTAQDRTESYKKYMLCNKIFSMVTNEHYKYRLDMASRIVKIKIFDFMVYQRAIIELGAEISLRKYNSFPKLKEGLRLSMTTLKMSKNIIEEEWKRDLIDLIITWIETKETYCPHNVIVLTDDERIQIWESMHKAKTSSEIFKRMMDSFEDRRSLKKERPDYYTDLSELCNETINDPKLAEALINPLMEDFKSQHEDELNAMTELCRDKFLVVCQKYLEVPSTLPFLILNKILSEVDKCVFHTKTSVYRRPLTGNLDVLISTSASKSNFQVSIRNIMSKSVIWSMTIDQTKIFSYKAQIFYNISILMNRLEASGTLLDFCEEKADFITLCTQAWIGMKPEIESMHTGYVEGDLEAFMSSGSNLICDIGTKYTGMRAARMIEFLNRFSAPALMENYQPHNTSLQQLRFPYMFSLSDRFSGREWGSKMLELNRRQATQLHSEWVYFCGFKALEARDNILAAGKNQYLHGNYIDPLTGIRGKNGDDFITYMYSVHYYDREALNFDFQSINTMMDFLKPTQEGFKVSEPYKDQLNQCPARGDINHLSMTLEGKFSYNQRCQNCKVALNHLSCMYQIPLFEVTTELQLERIIYDQCILSAKFKSTAVSSPYLQLQFGQYLSEHFSDEDHDAVRANSSFREPISNMSDTTGCMKTISGIVNPIKMLTKVYTKLERKTITSIRAASRTIGEASLCGVSVRQMMRSVPRSVVNNLTTFFMSSSSGNELQAKEILTTHDFDRIGAQSSGDLTYCGVKRAVNSFAGDTAAKNKTAEKFKENENNLPEDVLSEDIMKLLLAPRIRTSEKDKTQGYGEIVNKLKKKFNIKTKDQGAPVNVPMLFEMLYEELEKTGRCSVDNLRDLIKKDLKCMRLEKGQVTEVPISVQENECYTPAYIKACGEIESIFNSARKIRNESIQNPKLSFSIERNEVMRKLRSFMDRHEPMIKNSMMYMLALGTSHGLSPLMSSLDVFGIVFNYQTKAVLRHLMPYEIDAIQALGMNTILFGNDFLEVWMRGKTANSKSHDLEGVSRQLRDLMITMDLEEIKEKWLLNCLSAATGRKIDLLTAVKSKTGERIFLGSCVHSKVIFQIIEHLDTRIGNSFHLARSFIHSRYRYQATNAPKSQFAARRELMVQTYETKVVNHCIELISKAFLKRSRNDLMEHAERKDQVLDDCKKLLSARQEDPSQFLYIASADEKRWGPNACTMGFLNLVAETLKPHSSLLNLTTVGYIAALHKEVAFPEKMLERVMNIIMYKKLSIKEVNPGTFKIMTEGGNFVERDDELLDDVNDDIKQVLFDFILEGKSSCKAYFHMGQGIFHAGSSIAVLGELQWSHDVFRVLAERMGKQNTIGIKELRSSDDSILVIQDYSGLNQIEEKAIEEFLIIRCIARKLGCNVARSEKSCGGHMIAEVYSKFCTEEDLIPAIKQTCAMITSPCGTSVLATAQMLFNICSSSMDEGASLMSIYCNYRMRMTMDKCSLTRRGCFDSSSRDLPICMTGRFPITYSTLLKPLNNWECEKHLRLHQSAQIKLKSGEQPNLAECISISCPIENDDDVLGNYRSQHRAGKSKLILGDLISRPEMRAVKTIKEKLRNVKADLIDPLKSTTGFIFELLNTRGRAKSFESVLIKISQVVDASLLPDALARSSPQDRLQMVRSQILGKFVRASDKFFKGPAAIRNGNSFVSIGEFDEWTADPRGIGMQNINDRIHLMQAGITNDLEVGQRMIAKEQSAIELVQRVTVEPTRLSSKVFRGDVLKKFQLPSNVLFCGILSLPTLINYEPDIDLSKFNADEALLQTSYPNVLDYLLKVKDNLGYGVKEEDKSKIKRLCEILNVINPKPRKIYMLTDSMALFKDVPHQLCKYNVIRGLCLEYDEEPYRDTSNSLLAIQDYDELREALTIYSRSCGSSESLAYNVGNLLQQDPTLIDRILYSLKSTSIASAKSVMTSLKLYMNGMNGRDDISNAANIFVRSDCNTEATEVTDTLTLKSRRSQHFSTLTISYSIGLTTKVHLTSSTKNAEVLNTLITAYLANGIIRHAHKPYKAETLEAMLTDHPSATDLLTLHNGVWVIARDVGVGIKVSPSALNAQTLINSLTMTKDAKMRVNGPHLEFGYEYIPLSIPQNELLSLKASLSEMNSTSSERSELYRIIVNKSQEPFFSPAVRIPLLKSVSALKLEEAKTGKNFEDSPEACLVSVKESKFLVTRKVAELIRVFITPDKLTTMMDTNTITVKLKEKGCDLVELLEMVYNTKGKAQIPSNMIYSYMRFTTPDLTEIYNLLGLSSLVDLYRFKTLCNQVRRLKEGSLKEFKNDRVKLTLGDGTKAAVGLIIIDSLTGVDLKIITVLRDIDPSLSYFVKALSNGTKRIVVGTENWTLATSMAILLTEGKYGEGDLCRGLFWIFGLWHFEEHGNSTENMSEVDFDYTLVPVDWSTGEEVAASEEVEGFQHMMDFFSTLGE
uniref:RNA-dependent RNA polymerase n=1 Tax=Shahe bunya-like virus 3 TaxID=1923412 RepID=A0A1L3KPM3_9VIRU|nr:RNA-dependent RNA polymerase [Shahe bunya-like virus 3]